MEIKRERSTLSDRCLVRMNVCLPTLANFELLFAEAKKDFPELTTNDVTIQQYSSLSLSHTFGLEFQPPSEVPRTYRRREYLPAKY